VLAALTVLGSTAAGAQEAQASPPADTVAAGRFRIEPYAGVQATSSSRVIAAPLVGVRTSLAVAPRFRLVGEAQMSYSRTSLNGSVGTTGLLATAGAEADLLHRGGTTLSAGLQVGTMGTSYSFIVGGPDAGIPQVRVTYFDPVVSPTLRLSQRISTHLSVDLHLQDRIVSESRHGVAAGVTLRLHP
jgi:hypothetical protein